MLGGVVEGVAAGVAGGVELGDGVIVGVICGVAGGVGGSVAVGVDAGVCDVVGVAVDESLTVGERLKEPVPLPLGVAGTVDVDETLGVAAAVPL